MTTIGTDAAVIRDATPRFAPLALKVPRDPAALKETRAALVQKATWVTPALKELLVRWGRKD